MNAAILKLAKATGKRFLNFARKKLAGQQPTKSERAAGILVGGSLALIAGTIAIVFVILMAIPGLLLPEAPSPTCVKDGNISSSVNGLDPGALSTAGATQACLAAGYGRCPGNAWDSVQVEETSKVVTPLAKMPNVSSSYGWRIHPIQGGRKFHTGLDLPMPMGTPVLAAADGVIVKESTNSGAGNHIVHKAKVGGNIVFFTYKHLSAYVAKVGDKVKAGQEIGKVGSTGNSTGPHLHFEVGTGGDINFVDPGEWLKQNNAQGVAETTTDPATGEQVPLTPNAEGDGCDDSCGTGAASSATRSDGKYGGEIPLPPIENGPAKKFVEAAFSQAGKPYIWGGTSPAGFDCSGIVQWAAHQAGIKLAARTAAYQSKENQPVQESELRQGDLFYCSATPTSRIHHTGIIAEPGKSYFHAPKPGDHLKAVSGKPCPGEYARYGRLNFGAKTEGGVPTTGRGVVCVEPELDGTDKEALKNYTKQLMPNYGWAAGEFDAVDWIFTHESDWDPKAKNPSSTARGIPQCLKQGSTDKCTAHPFEDYDTNPKTQIKWGLDYIKNRYGSPSKAKAFWLSHNWY